MPQPVAIFSCAASQDILLLAQWETHILPLQQAGLITIWSQRHLNAGEPRQERIVQHLEQADIIVLLLSADFFVSSECREIMEEAFQRFRNNQTHVVPLLLRPSSWKETSLAKLSCLPTDERPITKWSDRDEAFQHCVNGIKQLLAQPPAAQSNHLAAIPPGPSSSTRYHSCFLAYAHQDQPLAQRLHDDLEARGVACWFALRDMKIGARIRPALDQAIHQQEKLLLLLSQHSITSAWIEDEVEAALEYERNEGREILFPISLDTSFVQTTQAWAAKIRRTRHIGDFTNWTEPQTYQQAFERLLQDLETEHTAPY